MSSVWQFFGGAFAASTIIICGGAIHFLNAKNPVGILMIVAAMLVGGSATSLLFEAAMKVRGGQGE